jgi:hypothetical protein
MPTTIPPPSQRYLFERPPWSQPFVWLLLGTLILIFDRLTGFYVQFPVLFLIPVLLTAWHRKLRWAILYAIVLCGIRFSFQFIWVAANSRMSTPVNALLRSSLLILLACFTSRIASLTRELRHRIRTLEGLLATCAHCKAIRDENGAWLPMEHYIASHSEATFSHGICPTCMEKHYADLFPEDGQN